MYTSKSKYFVTCVEYFINVIPTLYQIFQQSKLMCVSYSKNIQLIKFDETIYLLKKNNVMCYVTFIVYSS